MKISSKGLDVIKFYESCELKAYPDPGTGGAPWTIGWGHTGPEVVPGLVWTQKQADDQLLLDVASRESAISSAFCVLPQGQFDALVSFLFNVGPGRKNVKDGLFVLKSGQPSTLYRLAKAGDAVGASGQFKFWNKAAGKVMNGLTKRRESERQLFVS